MTNNLRKISKDLRAFAKRTKDFKYTDSALIIYLMTGMVSITTNLFPATTTTKVVDQDSSSNTDPSTKSSGEENHPKGEGETKPSLSEGKSE